MHTLLEEWLSVEWQKAGLAVRFLEDRGCQSSPGSVFARLRTLKRAGLVESRQFQGDRDTSWRWRALERRD